MPEYKLSRTGGWSFGRAEKIRQVLKEKVERRENVADFRVRDRPSGEMPATEHPITKGVFSSQELAATASTAPVTDKVASGAGIPEQRKEDRQSVSPSATVSSESALTNNLGPLRALALAQEKLAQSGIFGGSTVSSPHPSAPKRMSRTVSSTTSWLTKKPVSRARWLLPVVALGLLALVASGFWLFRGDEEVPRAAGQRSTAPRVMTAPQHDDRIELTSSQRRSIQVGLKAAGFDPGPSDGVFGPATRTAIRQWQAERRASVTGNLTESEVEELIALSKIVVAAELPEEKEGSVPRARNGSDRISGVVVAGGVAPESGPEETTSTEAPGNEALTESNGALASEGLAAAGTPVVDAVVMPQGTPSANGPSTTGKLFDWQLPAASEPLSKINYRKCQSDYDNAICLILDVQMTEMAYAFPILTVDSQVLNVPCDEKLPGKKVKSRRGEGDLPEWGFDIPENLASKRMSFHVLATTDEKTAERLFAHLKSAPGLCDKKDSAESNTGETGAWHAQLKLQVEGGNVAHLGIPVVLP